MLINIELLPQVGQINLRGRATKTLRAFEKYLNMSLPKQVNASNVSDKYAAFCLGPEEWLVITEYASVYQVSAELQACLGNNPGAVTNVADNRVCFSVTGQDSYMLLQMAAAIDSSLLKPGDVIQTLFGKVQVVVYCLDSHSIQIFVRTSFQDYTQLLLNKLSKSSSHLEEMDKSHK